MILYIKYFNFAYIRLTQKFILYIKSASVETMRWGHQQFEIKYCRTILQKVGMDPWTNVTTDNI